jgi:hypothetical protein
MTESKPWLSRETVPLTAPLTPVAGSCRKVDLRLNPVVECLGFADRHEFGIDQRHWSQSGLELQPLQEILVLARTRGGPHPR